MRAAAIQEQEWDVIVIGGGASGLGSAIESASRGYKTLLLEREDFASCTSSRSTKLIHGGVRYLEQGNLKLVKEALHERSFLLKKIPEIVTPRSIILPTKGTIEKNYFRIGLKMYGWLAGSHNIQKASILSQSMLCKALPHIKRDFTGGILFYDAQFDDSRLAIQLVKTLEDYGGKAYNYLSVRNIHSANNSLTVQDTKTCIEYTLKYKNLINATGIFHDDTCQMESPANKEKTIAFSRGSHLVLKSNIFKQKEGMLIPKTSDGRVLFILPWKGAIIAGTTDIELESAERNPQASRQEIEFIIQNIEEFYDLKIKESDIISTFAGIRPLVKNDPTQDSASISRDHKIRHSKSGMISISGGKWTTFRKMGEDVINQMEKHKKLPKTKSQRHNLKINNSLSLWKQAEELFAKQPTEKLIEQATPLIQSLKNTEFATSPEDILARRTRTTLLFPDQAAAWKQIISKKI